MNIYAGPFHLLWSSDLGQSWTIIEDDNVYGKKELSSIDVSESNEDAVYFSQHGSWNGDDIPDNNKRRSIYKASIDRNTNNWTVIDITGNLRSRTKEINGTVYKGLWFPINQP